MLSVITQPLHKLKLHIVNYADKNKITKALLIIVSWWGVASADECTAHIRDSNLTATDSDDRNRRPISLLGHASQQILNIVACRGATTAAGQAHLTACNCTHSDDAGHALAAAAVRPIVHVSVST